MEGKVHKLESVTVTKIEAVKPIAHCKASLFF